jgi:hypothetical protein
MNVKLVPYFGYFSLTPLSQTRTKLYILAPYKDIKEEERFIECVCNLFQAQLRWIFYYLHQL